MIWGKTYISYDDSVPLFTLFLMLPAIPSIKLVKHMNEPGLPIGKGSSTHHGSKQLLVSDGSVFRGSPGFSDTYWDACI